MPLPKLPPVSFEDFTSSLLGLPVSHIWRGYGSAIFLEFGFLRPRHRRDGTLGNPNGDWTLIIEWSWRIEGKRRIWSGSSSDEERWPRIFSCVKGATVASLTLVGRLPELDLGLSNGLHFVSVMTAEGDPQWGLIKRFNGQTHSVGVAAGRLEFKDETRDRLDLHNLASL